MILILILWYLIGALGIWVWYHSALKEWYCLFKESYWDYNKRKGYNGIEVLVTFSPILAILGPIVLVFTLATNPKYLTLYFKVPKNK